MRSMMKKSLAVFMIAIFAFMMVACGGGTAVPNPPGGAVNTPGATQTPDQPKTSEPAKDPVDLTISAAASLTDVLLELEKVYKEQQPHVTLTFNMGPSGQLQQQIEQGAPADVFLSAAQKQMNTLEEKDLIVKDTRVDILRNELVLVVNKDFTGVDSFEDLQKAEVKHIGIGSPESVPAGQYAKEVLENLKMWDALSSKFVEGQNVRAVLSFVETGNAEAGFVYGSDTVVSDKVKIVAPAPEGSNEPILYPAAVVKATKELEAASDFVKFLLTEEAQQILEDFGFSRL